jgi:hypothetical protein
MRKSRPCDFVVANPLTTHTPPLALRPLAPGDRIGAVADPGSVANVDESLSAPRPSPHLARWKIKAQADDGVVLARATIFGAPVLIAAQDERFLGGSAGANHAAALRRLFERAREERPAAVLLLLASGGVRLYARMIKPAGFDASPVLSRRCSICARRDTRADAGRRRRLRRIVGAGLRDGSVAFLPERSSVFPGPS